MFLNVKIDEELCIVFVLVVEVVDEDLCVYIEVCEICVLCCVGSVIWFDFVMLCGGL